MTFIQLYQCSFAYQCFRSIAGHNFFPSKIYTCISLLIGFSPLVVMWYVWRARALIVKCFKRIKDLDAYRMSRRKFHINIKSSTKLWAMCVCVCPWHAHRCHKIRLYDSIPPNTYHGPWFTNRLLPRRQYKPYGYENGTIAREHRHHFEFTKRYWVNNHFEIGRNHFDSKNYSYYILYSWEK